MKWSVEYFEELQGVRLHDYMEPLLARGEPHITPDEAARLKSSLNTYDEFHLVYALILLARFDVALVLDLLPATLAREEVSVFCAALDILNNIPPVHATPTLINAIRSSIESSNMTAGMRGEVEKILARFGDGRTSHS